MCIPIRRDQLVLSEGRQLVAPVLDHNDNVEHLPLTYIRQQRLNRRLQNNPAPYRQNALPLWLNGGVQQFLPEEPQLTQEAQSQGSS